MKAINIHIATNDKWAWLFKFIASFTGSAYSDERVQSPELSALIRQGEEDFAAGKGTVMTTEQLRALTNEVAQR